MGSPLCDHMGSSCLQYDSKLHTETVKYHDDSRILLCNYCVLQTAVVQWLERGLQLCQTCASNPYIFSHFCHQTGSNKNFVYDCLDFDSSSSNCSSSFVYRNLPFPRGSLPFINEDSSSSEFFPIDENYTKNNRSAVSYGSLPPINEDSSNNHSTVSYSSINEDSVKLFQIDDNYTKIINSGQQVPMLQPNNLDILKDSSCLDFNGDGTKEDVENVLPNTLDGETIFDLKEYHSDKDLILIDPQIDELTKHNVEETLPVDQGACWPFSTTGSKEGIDKLTTRDLINLSEHALIDCDKSYYAGGNGDLMDYAYEFDIKNHEIDTEKSYVYQEHDSTSKKNKLKQRVTTIDSYARVKSNDEKSLVEVVVAQPVSAGICRSEKPFTSNIFGPAGLRCGLSQLILTDELLPWEDQTYQHGKRCRLQQRKEGLNRFFAKKKKLKFGKRIRYESRKASADTKRRKKGRFVKAGAEYDYDPQANNIKKGTNKTTS